VPTVDPWAVGESHSGFASGLRHLWPRYSQSVVNELMASRQFTSQDGGRLGGESLRVATVCLSVTAINQPMER